ncbi:HIT-like domain-containing protein [Trichoderma gracile]
MGGFVPFIKALPPCFGFHDPISEEGDCEVCHTGKFQEVDFDGEDITKEEGEVRVNRKVKIVNDIRPAGEHHWLILPREHIRDIEQLQAKDLDLLLEMRSVRDELLRRHCNATDRIHCGYHRARERVLGPIHTIDRISVPHLHLHVIARPHDDTIPDKYSHWFVWTSEEEVFERVEKMAEASSERIDVSLGQGSRSDAKLEKECADSTPDSTLQIQQHHS